MILTQATLNYMFDCKPEEGLLINRYDRGRAMKGEIAGWLSAEGYYKTKIRGDTYFIHQLLWLHVYGYIPKEMDYINGIRSDNRIVNLREATRTQNLANAKLPTGISGLRGVNMNESGSKWRAMIHYGGQHIFLGNYDTKEEAAAVYKKAADHIYGEYALHNRPA